MKKQLLYPGTQEAKNARPQPYKGRRLDIDNLPDFIAGKPNYSKYEKRGYSPEKILALLNID